MKRGIAVSILKNEKGWWLGVYLAGIRREITK